MVLKCGEGRGRSRGRVGEGLTRKACRGFPLVMYSVSLLNQSAYILIRPHPSCVLKKIRVYYF